MKKSLVALAILATAGVASAQSSVTLFGVVDVNYAHGSGSGVGSSSKSQLTSGGYNTSRLGFRGTEDLGGGMSASFWLEAGINADNGTFQATNTNNQANGASVGSGLTFNRRSTVSLASGLGELRLGRDYTPQFWNQTVFDPFGTVGVGGSQANVSSLGGPVSVRASNSVGYFLPGNLGGFYGQFQHYLGENNKNGAATEKDGTGSAIRLGYANGPINVALATSSTKYAATATTGKIQSTNIGGSYDFGVAQAMALVTRDKVDSVPTNVTGKGALVGALVPMGAGQIRVAYSTYKTDAAGTPKSKKWALGYVHNLSKRTALYTTFARVTNSGGASQALNGAVTAVNARSTGYDFGIKHSF
ncbi:porin [Polaromonas sp. AET17H-212]|uniref:porin n=1 Tax=Polaromonas sp. AET17H-212 TaxID=1977061 RepID=UPI000BBBEC4C|nr:porin [Polaromonas sp. AET17H-212]